MNFDAITLDELQDECFAKLDACLGNDDYKSSLIKQVLAEQGYNNLDDRIILASVGGWNQALMQIRQKFEDIFTQANGQQIATMVTRSIREFFRRVGARPQPNGSEFQRMEIEET